MDKQYPVFGFGARLPDEDVISHCFSLNGRENSPQINDLEVYNFEKIFAFGVFFTLLELENGLQTRKSSTVYNELGLIIKAVSLYTNLLFVHKLF